MDGCCYAPCFYMGPRFLWSRLKYLFYFLWYKQGVLRTYSKKDHNGIPFIQRFLSAFYTLYMYIIHNRQWHLKKSTVLLHYPSLLWKPLKKFKDALFCHWLKACVAVPVTISKMGAGWLFTIFGMIMTGYKSSVTHKLSV